MPALKVSITNIYNSAPLDLVRFRLGEKPRWGIIGMAPERSSFCPVLVFEDGALPVLHNAVDRIGEPKAAFDGVVVNYGRQYQFAPIHSGDVAFPDSNNPAEIGAYIVALDEQNCLSVKLADYGRQGLFDLTSGATVRPLVLAQAAFLNWSLFLIDEDQRVTIMERGGQ